MRSSPLNSVRAIAWGVIALSVTAGCTAVADTASDGDKEIVLTESQLEFQNINPAIKMAAAYGDRSKGAHGSFGRFPANFETPYHTHTGSYHGIVIKGEMTNPFDGEASPPIMRAGSYWHVPASSAHATACVSSEPCEFYFYADQAFDFHPVE